MSFLAEESTGYTLLAGGEYLARCISVIDLGWQPSFKQSSAPRPRIGLEFEVANEFLASGEPRKLYLEFTRSLHRQSALRPFLEAWVGKLPANQNGLPQFDLSKLLDMPAKLIVIHKLKEDGGTRAVVQAALPPKKGEKTPKAISPLLLFDWDAQDAAVFQKLPKFVQEKVMAAIKPKEVEARSPGSSGNDAPDFNADLDF